MEGIFEALPDLYFRLDNSGKVLAHRSGRDSTLALPAELAREWERGAHVGYLGPTCRSSIVCADGPAIRCR